MMPPARKAAPDFRGNNTMKIVSVSLVKDECDIIELFIRINLRNVDRMFIVDNKSSDRTIEIIGKLQHEGLPVTLWHDDSVDFNQSVMTTGAIKRIVREYDVDWILPLDADEFITDNSSNWREELQEIPPDQCGMLEWRTFVPISNDYFTSNNPLWQHFRQRTTETVQFSKVLLPAYMAETTRITAGNHRLTAADNKPVPCHKLSATLAHVPVRSSEQIVSKSIIGSIKHQITVSRKPNEGFHKDMMAEFARECRYHLDIRKLQEVAFSYSQKPGNLVIRETDNAKRIGSPDDRILYRELSTIDILERFDAYMIELKTQLKNSAVENPSVNGLKKEIEQLKATLRDKEKELRFFRKTAIGKAVAYIVRMANRLKKTRKRQTLEK